MKIRSLVCFAVALIIPATYASYSGEYTVVSYNHIFSGTNAVPGSFGMEKQQYTEFSDLTVSASNNTYTNTMNEASVRRQIFDLPTPQGLVYNGYTNFVERGQGASNGIFAPLPYNNLEVDGKISLHFDSNTNVAFLIFAQENDADYDEIGLGMILRKTSGKTMADVQGAYAHITIGNDCYLNPTNNHIIEGLLSDTSTIQFNQGQLVEIGTEWSASRRIEDRLMGDVSDHYVDTFCTLEAPETNTYTNNTTYSVLNDGRVLVDIPPMGSITNQMTADANLIVTALAENEPNGSGSYLSMAIKKPTNMPTNAFDAVFLIAEIGEEYRSNPSASGANENIVGLSRSYMELKSDGTFKIRSDSWELSNSILNHQEDQGNGIVSFNRFDTRSFPRSIELDSGTYTLAPDGTVSLAFNSGDQGVGQLSENGQYVIYAYQEGDLGSADRWMGLGIRRIPPPEPSSPVEINSDFTLTQTGLVFSASIPTNSNIEVLQTSSLTDGVWNSLTSTNSSNGSVQVLDPDADQSSVHFYTTTFGVW